MFVRRIIAYLLSVCIVLGAISGTLRCNVLAEVVPTVTANSQIYSDYSENVSASEAVHSDLDSVLTLSPLPLLEASVTPELTPSPSPAKVPIYYCGLQEHIHSDECYSESVLLCLLPEHRHIQSCSLKPTPTPSAETPTPQPDLSFSTEQTPSIPSHEDQDDLIPTEVPGATDFTDQESVSPLPDGDIILVQTPTPSEMLCTQEEHIHSETCYQDTMLICTIREHMHSEACYLPTAPMVTAASSAIPDVELTNIHCGKEPHAHSNECLDDAGLYICGKDEHTHNEQCCYFPLQFDVSYSQKELAITLSINISGGKAPYALTVNDLPYGDEVYFITEEGAEEILFDAETAGEYQLTFTLKDDIGNSVSSQLLLSVKELEPAFQDFTASFAHLELGSDVRQNVLAILQTQIGYSESDTDFEMVKGSQKGYTRYGAWFGSPYQDWCAMFAAFCLHYAKIDDQFPLSGNVPAWIHSLQNAGYYQKATEYLPAVGDLIFFDYNHDGEGDHVGFVASLNESDGDKSLSLQTIEGNVNNAVTIREYSLFTDDTILGFAQIAPNETMDSIDRVIEKISLLPSLEEIETITTTLDDIQIQKAYFSQLTEQYFEATIAFEALSPVKQHYVINANKLEELAVLTIADTLDMQESGTAMVPVERTDDLRSVGSGSGIRFRLFNYDETINQNGHQSVFAFRGANKHDPEGDDTTINQSLDADGYVANRAKVKPLLSNGFPVFDGRGITSDFSLGYLFGAGGTGVTAYSPANTPLLRNASNNLFHYDSARNAVDFDIANNRFIVRNYVERGDSTAGFGGQYADFMPFTYWNNASVYQNENGVEYFYDSDKELDYWFGMTMDTSFFQPKNGYIADEEMIFSFSGDDDVWVFIDDVLVLDLGGTHGVVKGSINFATGQITQHLNWAGSTTPSYPTTLNECFERAGRTPNGGWSANGNTFADYSKHTFRFFYLERGAGSSNCKMTFNLPTLPDETLIISKELTSDSTNYETVDYLDDTLEYTFRVMQCDEKSNALDEFFLAPGTEFSIMEEGISIDTGVIQADGTFCLKAGQSAQFNEMIAKGNGAIRYVVQEILPKELTGQYGSIEYEISGEGGETKTDEGPSMAFSAFQTGMLTAEESQVVIFRNKIATNQLSMLQVTKEQSPGSNYDPEQYFDIQIMLGNQLLPIGTLYKIDTTGEIRAIERAGIVPLKVGETATILKGIISGTEYQITELPVDGMVFNPVFHGTITHDSISSEIGPSEDIIQGSFPLNSSIHIVVTNTSYDFSLELPVVKSAVGHTGKTAFEILVETGEWSDGMWTPVSSVPGTSISVSDSKPSYGKILIGYTTGTEGNFFYKLYEGDANEGFVNDSTFYIVEVTVRNNQASISSIWKNGSELLPSDSAFSFVNHQTLALTIEKKVTGSSIPADEKQFTFTLSLNNGGSFSFPESDDYVKLTDHSLRFALADKQQLTIPHIPRLSSITISETDGDGYIVYHHILPSERKENGSTVTLYNLAENAHVVFTNHMGYMLPETGGAGTDLYTAGGLCLSGIAYLLYKFKKNRKGGN